MRVIHGARQVANTLDASTMFRRNNMSLRLLKARFFPPSNMIFIIPSCI